MNSIKNDFINRVNKGLIVSCQALENEPLHSSFIMGRMALAAKEGGAVGIRANSVEDIKEIKNNVDLPIIGIIKKNYGACEVFITPTMKEIEDLCREKVDLIALDATKRARPDKKSIRELIRNIKEKYPNQLLMADISTLDEAEYAEKCGFDFVGTTLHGYTEYTKGQDIQSNDFKLIREIIERVKIPLIAEGNIDTPLKAKRCLELGALAVVTGGAITRPQLITKKFVDYISGNK